MNSELLIPNILGIALLFITLFIAIRAFAVYMQNQSMRLFTLGIAMGVISLTAVADLVSSNFWPTLNTSWFLYLGQAVSFLFIAISLIGNSEAYLQNVARLQVFASALLVVLLLFSPTLPDFPNPTIRAIFSGARSFFCICIFVCYISAFLKKQTRFSFLMSLSFLLLGLGYVLIAQRFFVVDQLLLDNIGDILRMGGLVTLLVAVLKG